MGITRRYLKWTDLPAKIPVFPLGGAILLPRASLPLNIFEPRYLEMIDYAISGDRIIGMIQPRVNSGETQSPEGKSVPLKSSGCAGRLTAFSETEDDHVLITLIGISRFEIKGEEDTEAPFRICEASFAPFADDLVHDVGSDDVDPDHLLEVLKTYLKVHDLQADWQGIHRSSSEFLVNTLSVISPYGPEEKQALLEAVDLKTRAEVLIALAEMDIASRGDGSGTTLQ
ncbi:MAG: LON peptidase substrate-binding domain-containing protein [Methyloligellaceae bacterium]